MKTIFSLNNNNVVQETLLSEPESLEFTLQFWLRAEGVGTIFQYQINTGNAFFLEANEQGKLVLTNVVEGDAHTEHTIRGRITDNNQKHVSVTKKDNTLFLFINGKLTPCREVAPVKKNNTQPIKSACLILGDRNSKRIPSLQGQLSGIKLWDNALPFTALHNYKKQTTEVNKKSCLLYSDVTLMPKTLTAERLENKAALENKEEQTALN